MTTYDLTHETPDWQLPPRCCGTWCTGSACTVCGRHERDIPTNITLGSE